jgi:hypothetical protein
MVILFADEEMIIKRNTPAQGKGRPPGSLKI